MSALSESNFISNQALTVALQSKGIAADSVISSDRRWVQAADQSGYDIIAVTSRALAGVVSSMRLAINAGELPKPDEKFHAETAHFKGAIASDLKTMLNIATPDHQLLPADFNAMADTFFAKTIEFAQKLKKIPPVSTGASTGR